MTPQMKQILEHFDNLPLCYPDIESDDTEQYYAGQAHMKQHMREFVMQSCIEYVQSILETPVKITVTNGDPIMQDRWDGIMNNIKRSYLEEIQQDSLDLPTNQ